MRWRICGWMIGAVLAVGAPRQAQAQAVDSAGLVRAVATVVVDSVVPRLGEREPNYVLPPASAFDSAVAAVLLRAPGMRPLPSRLPVKYELAGTRGLVMQGDTAVVRVQTTTHDGTQSFITTYIETYRYLFVRDADGWRYLRREFVSGADAGPVRGR